MKLKPLLLPWALLGLLGIVLLLGTSDTVHAQTFNPTFETTVADPRPGASSNFTGSFNLPEGDVMFGGLVAFIPPEWEITTGDQIPIGAIVGRLTSQATLGIINGQCNNVLPVVFFMQNASIDITDTVSFEDEDGNLIDDFAEDSDGNGLLDSIDRYPEFINRVLLDEDDNPLQPIRRSAGITVVAGVDVLLQFLIFEPGTFINENIPNDAELGYPSVTLLQNAGDPDPEPMPGAITDFCTPLISSNTSFGISKDNGCTDSIPREELDPICDANGAFLIECDDFGDNDGDLVNDGCPIVGDEGETACDDDVDDDADGWINDGCPAIGEPEDATHTDPNDEGVVLFRNPEAGTYTFTTISVGLRDADGDGFENLLDTCPLDPNVGDPRTGEGDADIDGLDAACDPSDQVTNSDEDLDGYLNRQDNCPLVANGENEDNQADSDVDEFGNEVGDQIGDACDPNPDTPDGELLIVSSEQEITIAGEPVEAPDGDTGAGGDDDDGGGSTLIIIIVVIAVVVVGGGGAFLYMRRGSGGGGTTA